MINNYSKIFSGKKILVTGGTGSIGSEIVLKLMLYKPNQIRVFSRDETKQFLLQQRIATMHSKVDVRFLIGDIRDKDRLDMAFANVDIVFHAAALKHVTFCEYNPFEAVKTNVYGTQNIIDLAIKHHVKRVIGISTDKAVNPANVMGITKLLMERMFLSTRWYLGDSETKFSTVRFGNVLDSRGSVTSLWKQQIHEDLPLTITDPAMTRYFMSIGQAVNLILKAACIMDGQEIFILKMRKKKIMTLAKEIFAQMKSSKPFETKIIGKRDTEKIHESLFTREERQNMIIQDDMYMLVPYNDLFLKKKKNK